MKRRAVDEQPVSGFDPIDDQEWMEEESDVGEEVRATLSALMPWGISILAHVGLIVIAFFLVWQTIVTEEPPPITPKSPIASPAVPMTPDPEPLDEPQPSGAVIQPVIAPITPFEIIAPTGKLPPVAIPVPDVPDIDTRPGPPRKSTNPPGKYLEFDGADRVVFLIDASGSMVDVLPFVIVELKRVVTKMQPKMVKGKPVYPDATVIFFSGKGVHEVPGGGGLRGLRAMTPTFKTQVNDWVSLDNFNYDTGGRGSAHVEAALIRALSYKPQLVILLSDNLTGGGQGATQHELMQDDLLDLIHKHNKANPPARFKTIQFLYEDPLIRHGLPGTLKRIADETAGEYKFVSQEDLHLR
ncbi:MAG: hypothetical protein AAF085_02910 [Planctomycetota bacterium]